MSKPLFESGIPAKGLPDQSVISETSFMQKQEPSVKPLFGSDSVQVSSPAKSNNQKEDTKVKPLFESGGKAEPIQIVAPAASEVPAPALKQNAGGFRDFSSLKADPVSTASPAVAAPVASAPAVAVDNFFEGARVVPAPKKQQAAVAPLFEGVMAYSDQAKKEILEIRTDLSFMQMEFLVELISDYYRLGFPAWQKYFDKLGNSNVEVNDGLHKAIKAHADVDPAGAIKAGLDFVKGNNGFLGLGKKSYDEVFAVLKAAESPKAAIQELISKIKVKSSQLSAQLDLILSVIPQMPSIKEKDRILAFLAPLQSSVLLTVSEIQIFEKRFESDVESLARLMYSQMPSMRSRS